LSRFGAKVQKLNAHFFITMLIPKTLCNALEMDKGKLPKLAVAKEREKEGEKERETEREKDGERKREKERERKRERERERESERVRERE
jgi:hypothetical protein